MSGILFLNGVDAKTQYSFDLVDAPDLLKMGDHDYQTAPVVQRSGVLLSTARPTVAPRTLRLSGFISGTSLTDARTKLDTLRAAVGTSPCTISTAWDTTKNFYGVLVASPAGPNSSYWDKYLAVELEFLLFDPYAYDSTISTVNFTTSATDIPLGTAPSKGNRIVETKIRITGPATTPVLYYRNSNNIEVSRMSFTNAGGYSPLTGDYIEINVSKGLVEKVVSGVRSNAMGALFPGWNFPALDPNDGNYLVSGWPQLFVTSGSGQITYYKAYR